MKKRKMYPVLLSANLRENFVLKSVMAILLLILFILHGMNQQQEFLSVFLYSSDKWECLQINLSKIFYYFAPCVLTMNYSQKRLIQRSLFEFIRYDDRTILFWNTLRELFLWDVLYVAITLVGQSFFYPGFLQWIIQAVLFPTVFVFHLYLWDFLSSILTKYKIGLLWIAILLVLFVLQIDGKLLITDQMTVSESIQCIGLHMGMCGLFIVLSFIIYQRKEII